MSSYREASSQRVVCRRAGAWPQDWPRRMHVWPEELSRGIDNRVSGFPDVSLEELTEHVAADGQPVEWLVPCRRSAMTSRTVELSEALLRSRLGQDLSIRESWDDGGQDRHGYAVSGSQI